MIANFNLEWRSISINLHPAQQEVAAKGRKAKHLAHYHGPATVTAIPRRRQLELQYEGKEFNRDISLVIPAKDFDSLDKDSFDPVICYFVRLEDTNRVEC